MRQRPGLIGDYRYDTAIFRSGVQRFWFVVFLVVIVYLGLESRPDSALPQLGFFHLGPDTMILAVTAMFASIGAIGLNIVTGYAGQVSLGHAFFLGLGAFTAAILGGVEQTREVLDIASNTMVEQKLLVGFELDMIIWLPAAGLVAALAGLIVAPVATRVRGLYLAFVTLGLVFLGLHVFREARQLTGGFGFGRPTAEASLLGFRLDLDGNVFGVMMTKEQKLFFFGLILLAVMGLAAKNLARSRIGRALSAVRDRDIAAEIMGIPLGRYKLLAFTISSFYAGIAGALLWAVFGRLLPEDFNLLLSIEYIAMVLIGGVATISGSIMGAVFIVFLPKFVQFLAGLPGVDLVISSKVGVGVFDVFQVERILFGLLIIGFLIFEPLGLYGIWIRIRNYWKAWPFSY
jgi:branched-chain amino acid transport system permease protein